MTNEHEPTPWQQAEQDRRQADLLATIFGRGPAITGEPDNDSNGWLDQDE